MAITPVSTGALAATIVGLLAGCSAEAPVKVTSEPTSAVKSKYPEPIDLARARADCLEKQGWAVEVDDEARITADLKPGTETDYNQDDVACLKKLGIDPDAPPTDAQYRQAYADSVKGAKCLRAGGWQISAAPTFGTFKDTYDSDPWYPWAEVPDIDAEDAAQQCPTPEPTY